MKAWITLGLVGGVAVARLVAVQTTSPVLDRSPVIVEAGPHHRVVHQIWRVVDEKGTAGLSTNSYVEMASGLNQYDRQRGQWLPAKAEFERTATGHFVARQTHHQLILAPHLKEEGAVDLLTPDGLRLRSTILGVALVDRGSGESVLLGEVVDGAAEWIAANQVIWRNAFEGLAADVRYTIGLERFEQDIILRERITPELVRAAGMDPGSACVVVLTEFFDPPKPIRKPGSTGGGVNPADEHLQFGTMTVGRGNAFGPEVQGVDAQVPVGKTWEVLEGRQFLIESVSYAAMAPLLNALPPPEQGRLDALKAKARRSVRVEPGSDKTRRTRWAGLLPSRAPPTARADRAGGPAFAQGSVTGADPTRAWVQAGPTETGGRHLGVVIDYVTINTSQSNHTFRGDTTYYLSGPVILSGTTTVEGGAVIKYARSASLDIQGPLNCQTGPFRPAIFTAQDENIVGETIAGSTGSPSGYYAAPAIRWDSEAGAPVCNLRFLRVAWADRGVVFESGTGHVLSHAQFVNCREAVCPHTADASVRNALFTNTVNVVEGIAPASLHGEHWTVNGASALNCGGSTTLVLTNSILVAVTGQTNFTGCSNVVLVSSSGVFQAVGAASHYLAANSPYRNMGTAAVNPALAADLQRMTTYPPIVLTNDLFSDTMLSARAQRDNDTPDLGYHYVPLDYCWSNLNLTNAALVLTNGVAVGVYGSTGLALQSGARFYCEGTANNLNRLVRYTTVQEQPISWGTSGGSLRLLDAGAAASPLAQVSLRFTEVSLLADASANRQWLSGAGVNPVAVSHSRLRGVFWTMSSSAARTVALTNTLCEQVFAEWGNGGDAVTVYARNNLFRGCTFNLNANLSANSWEWRDNLFDNTMCWQYYGAISNSNNGYLNSCRLIPSSTSDTLLTSFTYTNGPLGEYYQYSTNLYDKGSRTADVAGLYHYSVRPNQSKEANSPVDIGFHYVATDANGNPVDTDGDGTPDYLEDPNGNGVFDSGLGETNSQISGNGTTGVPGLQVFTPLR